MLYARGGDANKLVGMRGNIYQGDNLINRNLCTKRLALSVELIVENSFDLFELP